MRRINCVEGVLRVLSLCCFIDKSTLKTSKTFKTFLTAQLGHGLIVQWIE